MACAASSQEVRSPSIRVIPESKIEERREIDDKISEISEKFFENHNKYQARRLRERAKLALSRAENSSDYEIVLNAYRLVKIAKFKAADLALIKWNERVEAGGDRPQESLESFTERCHDYYSEKVDLLNKKLDELDIKFES